MNIVFVSSIRQADALRVIEDLESRGRQHFEAALALRRIVNLPAARAIAVDAEARPTAVRSAPRGGRPNLKSNDDVAETSVPADRHVNPSPPALDLEVGGEPWRARVAAFLVRDVFTLPGAVAPNSPVRWIGIGDVVDRVHRQFGAAPFDPVLAVCRELVQEGGCDEDRPGGELCFRRAAGGPAPTPAERLARGPTTPVKRTSPAPPLRAKAVRPRPSTLSEDMQPDKREKPAALSAGTIEAMAKAVTARRQIVEILTAIRGTPEEPLSFGQLQKRLDATLGQSSLLAVLSVLVTERVITKVNKDGKPFLRLFLDGDPVGPDVRQIAIPIFDLEALREAVEQLLAGGVTFSETEIVQHVQKTVPAASRERIAAALVALETNDQLERITFGSLTRWRKKTAAAAVVA